MSTFSGLNTALSGLNASRLALEVSGQNISNVNTPGYTRQRSDISGVGAVAATGLFAARTGVGQGVTIIGIARLADAHLDARVHGTLAAASFSDTRASGLADLEGILREPGDNGLSALLSTFWSGWNDVANRPGEAAPAAVLIQSAQAIASRLELSQTEVGGQWAAQRGSLDTMAAELNATAVSIAEMNGRIRSIQSAGGNANEMLDRRDTLISRVSQLAGGTTRENADGTVDVLLGGNALVSGTTARSLTVHGAPTLATLDDQSTPALRWADGQQQPVDLDAGRLAAALSLVAPANGSGTGGQLAETAKNFDAVARSLAEKVNAVHSGGSTVKGDLAGNFFTIGADGRLEVAVTGAGDLATGTPGAGALDGSNAAALGKLGELKDGPDALWSASVVSIGLASKSASQQAVTAAVASVTAISMQQSNAGVSLDEENVALLANQHAYQGAARVMTAIDEMLDTLINRTGLVGR